MEEKPVEGTEEIPAPTIPAAEIPPQANGAGHEQDLAAEAAKPEAEPAVPAEFVLRSSIHSPKAMARTARNGRAGGAAGYAKSRQVMDRGCLNAPRAVMV